MPFGTLSHISIVINMHVKSYDKKSGSYSSATKNPHVVVVVCVCVFFFSLFLVVMT